MATEDRIGRGDEFDEESADRRDNGKDRTGSATAERRATRTADRERRASKRGGTEPLLNAIEARRRPKKTRSTQLAPADAERVDDLPQPFPEKPADAGAGAGAGTESDPWTVPQSVRDRFVQDGHRFYFPDGKEAFKDRGRRLTTISENTQVIHSLIEIAHSRGWTEVTVRGTERFRQEAWRQARMAGLSVRGYKPNEAEQEQLIRALGRGLRQGADRVDSVSADAAPASSAPPHSPPVSATAERGRERIAGKLLEHGRDNYRHDPNEDPSYFVRLQTPEGSREVWGKDIERAIAQSLTQPQIGDEVVLQQAGREPVTVKRVERDDEGRLHPREANTYRNRWVIEKRAFFDERAQAAELLRNASIDPRTAMRERPQLAGTYLNLRAAELVARELRDPQDRQRFVHQVRAALADAIERGEPLQPVRLRERAHPVTPPSPPRREVGRARE
jgi:Large polyvalent protein-associated domain 7